MKPITALYTLTFILVAISVMQCRSEEVPVVLTGEISNITVTSASSGGSIVSDGGAKILSRGVCWRNALDRWSIPQEPIVEDRKTIDGAGTEPFTSQLTGLDPGTTYYVRAYAITKHGVGYGPEKTFRTEGNLPSAETRPIKNITAFTANLEAIVDPKGISAEVSFEYGLTATYGNKIEAQPGNLHGDSSALVTAAITNLLPNTNYHFRIIARNILGTVYSPDQTFKTSEIAWDIDGTTYEVITIGKQKWMKENLKTTRYRDGSVIPLITSASAWSGVESGAYTCYNNDNSNTTRYGALYNWYAVTDQRGLCPDGWHVPTNEDFADLANYLGGVEIAGGKLKEAGTNRWITPNDGADNSSNFSATGSGFRDHKGAFSEIDRVAYLWSSNEYSATHGIARKLYFNKGIVSFSGNYKQCGFSVRCIKD